MSAFKEWATSFTAHIEASVLTSVCVCEIQISTPSVLLYSSPLSFVETESLSDAGALHFN